MRNKILFFEYFVDALVRRNNNKTDTFTPQKIIRLLFLTVGLYSTDENKHLSIDLDNDSKQVVDDAVNLLFEKNPNILNYQPTHLVDIVQKWSCWKICYDVALTNGNFNIIIPPKMIRNSIKYYD